VKYRYVVVYVSSLDEYYGVAAVFRSKDEAEKYAIENNKDSNIEIEYLVEEIPYYD
jgi:hypothetical protein